MNELWKQEPDLTQLRYAHDLLTTEPAKALVVLQKLADDGSVMSMIYLAGGFEAGIFGVISLPEAEKWYLRAYENGSYTAQFNLGALYFNSGQYDAAKKIFMNGVSQDDPPSMYWLARIYLRDKGNGESLNRARNLLERAAGRGHFYARRKLSVLTMKGCFGMWKAPRGFCMFLATAVAGIKIARDHPHRRGLH
ncbi:MAG: tetratricopeptide repeat protein [Acidiphilium sp.]